MIILHIIDKHHSMPSDALDKPIDDVVAVHYASLIDAVLARDVDTIRSMLSSGADPNARKVGKEMPAWRSVDGRHMKPERQDPNSRHQLYPLDLAITSRAACSRIVNLLLEHGADPNSRYPQTTIAHRILERKGSSPYMTHGKRNVYLDLILRHPLLDINLQDEGGVPLIQTALEVGDAKAARILIERGADLFYRDGTGRNVLHLVSADLCANDLVQNIIALAPDLQYQFDEDGRTPLQYAIDCQKPGIPRDGVNLLISAGVDVTVRDANGDTPLHILFRRPFLLVVDYYGDAVWQGFVKKTIELLLSKGADINAQNKAGETPVFGYFRASSFKVDLTWAKMDEEKHALSKKWGGDRWKVTKELKNQIAEEMEPKIWAIFDEMGVDWSVVNARGEALLHVVAGQECSTGRIARFQFLVGKGLDPMAEDMEGQTALDVAANRKADDILALYKTE
jgi:ankyrin repeat protein